MNLLTSAFTISCLLASISASALPEESTLEVQPRFDEIVRNIILGSKSQTSNHLIFSNESLPGHIKYLSDNKTKLAVTSEDSFGLFMHALKIKKSSLKGRMEGNITMLQSLKTDKLMEMVKPFFNKNKNKIAEFENEIDARNKEIEKIKDEIEILDNFTFYCAIGECHKVVDDSKPPVGDDERVVKKSGYRPRSQTE